MIIPKTAPKVIHSPVSSNRIISREPERDLEFEKIPAEKKNLEKLIGSLVEDLPLERILGRGQLERLIGPQKLERHIYKREKI